VIILHGIEEGDVVPSGRLWVMGWQKREAQEHEGPYQCFYHKRLSEAHDDVLAQKIFLSILQQSDKRIFAPFRKRFPGFEVEVAVV